MYNEDYDNYPTVADAMREYVRNAGSDRPDREWILSPYDTWERNPSYQGPPGPHPECTENEFLEWEAKQPLQLEATEPSRTLDDDDLPF